MVLESQTYSCYKIFFDFCIGNSSITHPFLYPPFGSPRTGDPTTRVGHLGPQNFDSVESLEWALDFDLLPKEHGRCTAEFERDFVLLGVMLDEDRVGSGDRGVRVFQGVRLAVAGFLSGGLLLGPIDAPCGRLHKVWKIGRIRKYQLHAD